LSRSTILVLGASGQVGGAALHSLETVGDVVAPMRQQVDLTDPESIRSVMREISPLWVINAAAHTAVDKAESEPQLAYAINAEAPRILGEEAQKSGAVVIHFSTDYVFDGSNSSRYVESDPTGPLNVYGKSKLAGEQALAATGAAHLILRTSWVYGATGKNFLLSILRMARERDQLRIVADQHGAPTWSFDLARLTAHLVKHVNRLASEVGCDAATAAAPLSGIYHASGAGNTTWFGFAEAAVEALRKYEPAGQLATVYPISTAEYPTPARRPANSLLDCSKLERNFGWRMMHWQESLEQVMHDLFAGANATKG
jgi:dTDP-4-dehydrorhamnose reductase